MLGKYIPGIYKETITVIKTQMTVKKKIVYSSGFACPPASHKNTTFNGKLLISATGTDCRL